MRTRSEDMALFAALRTQFMLTPVIEENAEIIECLVNLFSELNEKHKKDAEWAAFVRDDKAYSHFFRAALRERKIDASTYRKFMLS